MKHKIFILSCLFFWIPLWSVASQKSSVVSLCDAIAKKDNGTLRSLLKAGKAWKKDLTCSPLFLAIRSKNPEGLSLLLESGADIESKNEEGQTLVIYATYYGSLESVKILLEGGADLYAKDFYGYNALDYALEREFPSIVDFFLKAGLSQVHPRVFISALERAAEARDEKKLRLLENSIYTENLSSVKENGVPVIFIFIEKNNVRAIEILLQKKYDINVEDDYMSTPLLKALALKERDLAKLFLERGADVSVQNDYTQSAVLLASQNGYDDVLLILLKKGGNPNVPNSAGTTPLIEAAKNSFLEGVRVLLEFHADRNAPDNSGKRALDYALENNRQDIANLLKDAGGAR